MTRTLNPHISLRPVEHADVRWFELWDQDPHVIAATTDRPGATVAFEGTEWAEAMMRLACMLCFANRAVTAIVIDPLNSNTRAHAFYRRLGFVATHRQIFGGTDDCLVHRLTRARWARHFPDDLSGCRWPCEGGILARPHKDDGASMTNRREFLQGGAAASLLVLSPGALAAVEQLRHSAVPPFYKVLFDARRDASVRFAAAFAEQGVGTYALRNGDITPFWRNELAALWAQGPVPVAGLTDANVLFCLEQLAPQYGLRVLHRETQGAGLVAWVIAAR